MKLRYDKENEQFIVTESTRIEYHQLELWLTRHVKGWKYQPAVRAGVWDGKCLILKMVDLVWVFGKKQLLD